MTLASFAVLLILPALAYGNNATAPQWVQLGCDSEQYLFSDSTSTWDEAREDCMLYGGALVMVGTLGEYNCLLRYGNSHGFRTWFWTDVQYISWIYIFLGSVRSSRSHYLCPSVCYKVLSRSLNLHLSQVSLRSLLGLS